MTDNKKEVRIMPASRMLQAKVGTGGIDEKMVDKCQTVLDKCDADFRPMGKKLVASLGAAVKKGQESLKSGTGSADALKEILNMMMQIKGTASMFQYPLMGRMAGTMLDLFETAPALNQDLLALAEANLKTLTLVLEAGMKGDGGAQGALLEKELRDACNRYAVKHGAPIAPASQAADSESD